MAKEEARASNDRREFYDSTATLYNITFPWIWRIGFSSLHSRMLKDFNGCDTILDAGTGVGYWLRHLARKGGFSKVLGMDFSEPYLVYARRRAEGLANAQCEQQDILAMNYADSSFDGILCSGVLDTMPEPNLASLEMNRVLKPDGKLIWTTRIFLFTY